MKVFRDSNCCSLMACRDVALQHLSIPMPRTNCRSIIFCMTMLLYCRFHRVVYTSHLFILENLAVHLYVLPILQKTLPCICMHHQFRVETLLCNVSTRCKKKNICQNIDKYCCCSSFFKKLYTFLSRVIVTRSHEMRIVVSSTGRYSCLLNLNIV